MDTNFETAFQLTVGNEGGFQNDWKDRGNWTSGIPGVGERKGTKFGISAMSYPKLDIANLSIDAARGIYYTDYWSPAGCDHLPLPVACEVFDAAVNHGVDRALDFVDETDPSIEDPQLWKARLIARRLRFYTGIRTWLTYGRGWVLRVAKNLENGT